MSGSSIPFRRSAPSWLKTSAKDLTDEIYKFSRKGLRPAQIGIILRDSHGVAQSRSVTGKKILRVLKALGKLRLLSSYLFLKKTRDPIGARHLPAALSMHMHGCRSSAVCVLHAFYCLALLFADLLALCRGYPPGEQPAIPEDLYFLIKKAINVRKHMERNRADKDSKFRLILIESRIHRLARYYRSTRKLHAGWKLVALFVGQTSFVLVFLLNAMA